MSDPSQHVAQYNSTTLHGWPAIEQMQWNRSCQSYGEFFAAFMQPNLFDKTQTAGINLQLGTNWMMKSFPEGWDQTRFAPLASVGLNETKFTPEELPAVQQAVTRIMSGYYLSQVQNVRELNIAFVIQVLNTSYACPAEACMAMAASANPDMTGIGVMISYYIEAGIATLFLIFFTIQRFKSWAHKKALRAGDSRRAATFSRPVARRVMDAFQGTLESFLLAAMLLAAAMLVAGIFVIAENIEDRFKVSGELVPASSYHDVPLSVLACAFAVFPVLVAYSVIRHPGQGESGAHKKWLARASLFVIWILGIAVAYMAPVGDAAFKQTAGEIQEEQQFAEMTGLKHDIMEWCDHRGGNAYRNGLKAAMALVVVAPLTWTLVFAFLHTGFLIPGVAGSKWLRVWLPWCRLAIGWICLAFTWGVLGYLQWLRQKLRDASGRLGEDGKWGFGQILALSVWVPVIFEFIYILLWGLQDSLSGSLPPEYEAVLRQYQPSHDPEQTDPRFTYIGALPTKDTGYKGYGGGDGGLHHASKTLPGGYVSTASTTPALGISSPQTFGMSSPSTMYDPHMMSPQFMVPGQTSPQFQMTGEQMEQLQFFMQQQQQQQQQPPHFRPPQ